MGKTKTKTRTVEDSPKPPITIRSTNPKILDDNIAKLEKAIQASDVSANPSGTAEETLLSTIGIDGKKYELGPSAENTSYDNTDSELTATDTQAAIDEVVSMVGDIEAKGAMWAILYNQNAYSASAQTVDTTQLRSLTKYPILCFMFKKAGILRNTIICPSDLFADGLVIDMSYVGGASDRHALNISYVSETSVSISADQNNSDYSLSIYALSSTKEF